MQNIKKISAETVQKHLRQGQAREVMTLKILIDTRHNVVEQTISPDFQYLFNGLTLFFMRYSSETFLASFDSFLDLSAQKETDVYYITIYITFPNSITICNVKHFFLKLRTKLKITLSIRIDLSKQTTTRKEINSNDLLMRNLKHHFLADTRRALK